MRYYYTYVFVWLITRVESECGKTNDDCLYVPEFSLIGGEEAAICSDLAYILDQGNEPEYTVCLCESAESCDTTTSLECTGCTSCETFCWSCDLNTNICSAIGHDGPSITSGPTASSWTCEDTCAYANDGECDDGGPGSSFHVCALGTDCSDCGDRANDGVFQCPENAFCNFIDSDDADLDRTDFALCIDTAAGNSCVCDGAQCECLETGCACDPCIRCAPWECSPLPEKIPPPTLTPTSILTTPPTEIPTLFPSSFAHDILPPSPPENFIEASSSSTKKKSKSNGFSRMLILILALFALVLLLVLGVFYCLCSAHSFRVSSFFGHQNNRELLHLNSNNNHPSAPIPLDAIEMMAPVPDDIPDSKQDINFENNTILLSSVVQHH